MNLEKIYHEEDLFPREIASWEERDYGFLFYNEENKDSYDSNHAIIFREKVSDLGQVLEDIVSFYGEKGICPVIYQSISDEGYFEEMKTKFMEYGFESWTEEQRYMVLAEKNTIKPNSQVVVSKVSEWREEYATDIFEEAGEPWEIDVAKRALANRNTLFFVAFYDGKPVGMVHSHITDGVWRGDYLLVAKGFRNIGVGRALMHSLVEYCNANQIDNCYLWTDGETAEKIYNEAGFRYVETKRAGRAVYRKKGINMRFEKSTSMKIELLPEQEGMLSSKEKIEKACTSPIVWAYDIYHNDLLIGFALVRKFEEDEFFLWDYAIDHRYQNQGYGTAALREFIPFMQAEHGMKRMTTTYLWGNDHAKYIYEKVGFVETDVVDEEDCHEVNMIYVCR